MGLPNALPDVLDVMGELLFAVCDTIGIYGVKKKCSNVETQFGQDVVYFYYKNIVLHTTKLYLRLLVLCFHVGVY